MKPAAIEGDSAVLPSSPGAGVVMHFTSLPSPYGIGDIGDAAQAFLQQLSELGFAVWQFLPTGPTAYGDSPYQPLSAFAGNEMLVGLEPLQRAGLLQAAELQSLAGLDPASVDYGQLIPAKWKLLLLAARRFRSSASAGMQSAYAGFLKRHSAAWLDAYAEYRVLKSLHREKPWPEWGKAFIRREPQAISMLREEHADWLDQLRVVQFFFYQQWQELYERATTLGIRLFGDMPIYIALDSSDAWDNPGLLLVDHNGQPSHVAGVPPDYFSEDGQLWGNPLYDWEAHERTGYEWWIARTRHALQYNHLVRIDHFRGFESYWSVPASESTARKGEWLRGPRDGLFLSLENALGRLAIVAENLGVITPEVEALRLRHRMPGMIVLQFALADPGFDVDAIAADCVCYTGTHDNDTSLGWFQGGLNDTRSANELLATQKQVLGITGGIAATVHTDLIRIAFGSPAKLAMVPMQDLLGLDSAGRLNKPGTTMDNWRWRMLPDALDAAVMKSIRQLLAEHSRSTMAE